MNRRTFFSLAASALSAVGLSAAAVSVAEAGPGPIPGLCDDYKALGYGTRSLCVQAECHKNYEAWGYRHAKACRQANG